MSVPIEPTSKAISNPSPAGPNTDIRADLLPAAATTLPAFLTICSAALPVTFP